MAKWQITKYLQRASVYDDDRLDVDINVNKDEDLRLRIYCIKVLLLHILIEMEWYYHWHFSQTMIPMLFTFHGLHKSKAVFESK